MDYYQHGALDYVSIFWQITKKPGNTINHEPCLPSIRRI